MKPDSTAVTQVRTGVAFGAAVRHMSCSPCCVTPCGRLVVGIPSGRSHSSSPGGPAVSDGPLFEGAFPYQQDVLALPVVDLDAASRWYASAFGLREVERRGQPHPTVVLERDGIRIGFALNGGDASQDGAAILVSDIHRAKKEIEAAGVEIANWRIDENDGERRQVFFVVAPDGLCFYFYQPLPKS